MEKTADHLRRVPMPGRWKQEQSSKNVLSEEATDFGFGKNNHQPDAPTPGTLDAAYDFWQRNQSPANMDRLLQAAKPTIGKALSSFAGGDKAMTARAKRLVVDAVKMFDPKRGAKLNTHLMIRLQPLQREYTNRSSIFSVPERVQLDRFRLEQSELALTDELGREPSDDELADYTGFSTRRIAHVRKFARRGYAESQMRTPEGEPVQVASEAVDPEDVWFEYVHYDLDPIDKKILEWKTGMYDKKTLSTNEIARRLKITPSAVSQRAAKIALKLENVGG
jgi:DNA-directed RNA polymerase specialized sigma subunit